MKFLLFTKNVSLHFELNKELMEGVNQYLFQRLQVLSRGADNRLDFCQIACIHD